MPFTLTKQFSFEACHSLPHLLDGHKCKRHHGHSYRVELVVEAEGTDWRGFAGGVDYADLKPFGDYLNERFDHQDLNVIMGGGENTTAERLAKHFYGWCRDNMRNMGVTAVRVSETRRTWVEYRA